MITTTLRELQVEDEGAADAALEVLRTDLVMLQMPSVFVLLAPPTRRGIAALDRAKDRLPRKNYGTALGRLDRFCSMVRPGSLPRELETADRLATLTGAFLRVSIASDDFRSPVARSGTHQGVLVDGPHRALFTALEAALEADAEPELFAGHPYGAALCTSANISGDPGGSITAWEQARDFAVAREVPLVLRCEPAPGPAGSYPIFWLQRDQVTVAREGPGLEQLAASIPTRLLALH